MSTHSVNADLERICVKWTEVMSHLLCRLRRVCNIQILPAKSFDVFVVIEARWDVKINRCSGDVVVLIIVCIVTLMEFRAEESSKAVTK